MNELPPEEKWLRLSEEKNAVDYLEKAAIFMKSVSENYDDWKWAIIGLHGALYGFSQLAAVLTPGA